jgi:hypothetical protein
MRKLDLLHLSSREVIANDAPDSPKIGIPALPITTPDQMPAPARDVPDRRRERVLRRMDAAARNHAPSAPPLRALRPRRRS